VGRGCFFFQVEFMIAEGQARKLCPKGTFRGVDGNQRWAGCGGNPKAVYGKKGKKKTVVISRSGNATGFLAETLGQYTKLFVFFFLRMPIPEAQTVRLKPLE